ncbi:hypothetical protein THAOC_07462, partial [Thalassiosira oceanica]
PQRSSGGRECEGFMKAPIGGKVDSEKEQGSLKEGHRRPNTSEVLLSNFTDNTSTHLEPDSISVSVADLSTKLLMHDRNAKNWTQPLVILQDDGSTCDVGCKDAFPQVKKMLENGGPPLTVRQSPSASRSSSERLSNWTLCCPGHRINPGEKDQFDEGKRAMSGIRDQSKLRQKTSGSKNRGTNSMHSKSAKAALTAPASAPKAPNRRTTSNAAKDKESRCTYVLNLFLARDDHRYIGQFSDLTHKGHPKIPPCAHSIGMRDLNEKDSQFIAICNDIGIEGSKIAKLLERMKEEQGILGTIVPKSIYHMSQKTKKMADLSKGITSDMGEQSSSLGAGFWCAMLPATLSTSPALTLPSSSFGSAFWGVNLPESPAEQSSSSMGSLSFMSDRRKKSMSLPKSSTGLSMGLSISNFSAKASSRFDLASFSFKNFLNK